MHKPQKRIMSGWSHMYDSFPLISIKQPNYLLLENNFISWNVNHVISILYMLIANVNLHRKQTKFPFYTA